MQMFLISLWTILNIRPYWTDIEIFLYLVNEYTYCSSLPIGRYFLIIQFRDFCIHPLKVCIYNIDCISYTFQNIPLLFTLGDMHTFPGLIGEYPHYPPPPPIDTDIKTLPISFENVRTVHLYNFADISVCHQRISVPFSFADIQIISYTISEYLYHVHPYRHLDTVFTNFVRYFLTSYCSFQLICR